MYEHIMSLQLADATRRGAADRYREAEYVRAAVRARRARRRAAVRAAAGWAGRLLRAAADSLPSGRRSVRGWSALRPGMARRVR